MRQDSGGSSITLVGGALASCQHLTATGQQLQWSSQDDVAGALVNGRRDAAPRLNGSNHCDCDARPPGATLSPPPAGAAAAAAAAAAANSDQGPALRPLVARFLDSLPSLGRFTSLDAPSTVHSLDDEPCRGDAGSSDDNASISSSAGGAAQQSRVRDVPESNGSVMTLSPPSPRAPADDRGDTSGGRCVFVGGLPGSVCERALVELFGRCGRIEKLLLARQAGGSNASLNYGWVVYEAETGSTRAQAELDGAPLAASRICVRASTRRF